MRRQGNSRDHIYTYITLLKQDLFEILDQTYLIVLFYFITTAKYCRFFIINSLFIIINMFFNQ